MCFCLLLRFVRFRILSSYSFLESEEMWRLLLQRDFGLTMELSAGAETATNGQAFQYYPTLEIYKPKKGQGGGQRSPTASIFGIDPVSTDHRRSSNEDSVFLQRTTSAFQAWKSWILARNLYYGQHNEINHNDNVQQGASSVVDGNPNTSGGGGGGDVSVQISFGRLMHAPYFVRAAKIWRSIITWCNQHLQQQQSSGGSSRGRQSTPLGGRILLTLTRGKNFQFWKEEILPLLIENDDDDGTAARHEQAAVPDGLLASQAVYAFCGGQQRVFDFGTAFDGVLGGYNAYSYFSCSHLVGPTILGHDLHEADDGTGITRGPNNKLMVGKCYLSAESGIGKDLFIEPNTGRLCFSIGRSRIIPALRRQPRVANSDTHDDFLVWLEEYAHRLETGRFTTDSLPQNFGEYISVYPKFPSTNDGNDRSDNEQGRIPVVSRAVTKGIEVIASSVYVPQGGHRFGIIYSIRVRIIPPGEEGHVTASDRGFETCQLESRHWRITDSTTNRTEHVDGRGVIGMYPILYEGGYTESGDEGNGFFVYQSCSGPTEGSFGGHITFIPGTLHNPTGSPFDVSLAPFRLTTMPDFLY